MGNALCAPEACGCGKVSTIDPRVATEEIQRNCPEILLKDEKIHFCFVHKFGDFRADERRPWGVDYDGRPIALLFFTNCRIMMKEEHGDWGTSVQWHTVPYTSIKSFYVQTAGALDSEVELGFWALGLGKQDFKMSEPMPSPKFSITLSKWGVDLIALQRLINTKIFKPSDDDVVAAVGGGQEGGGLSAFIDILAGDAREIDPKLVQEQLRSDPPILLPDEEVDMAFRCGRDSTVLTNRRLLYIDVQGMIGMKVLYKSYPWTSIRAFAAQTPGFLIDRDAELTLWTSIKHVDENKFQLDLRDSGTDILAIQRYLADRLLGVDTEPPAAGACKDKNSDGILAAMQALITGDCRQVDPEEANRKFHEDVELLQGCEKCEMAFKSIRDMVLFTSKRLILIDVQGLVGAKVEYKSIPWSTVQAFALQSAAAFTDIDAEMMIWTDIFYSCKTESEGDKTVYVPEPGQSYYTIDFQKNKVDLPAMGRYLAARVAVLGSETDLPPAPFMAGGGGTWSLDRFITWLGDDYHQCDPDELDGQMHGDCAMLLPNEKVQMGFVCGRDTVIMTTHRLMKIDKKGLTGTQVLYLSLPWTKIRAYEVESAGRWDMDAKMAVQIKAPWYNRTLGAGLQVDFAKFRANILAMNKFISEQVIGKADGSSAVGRKVEPEEQEDKASSFLDWMGEEYTQITTAEAAEKLATDPNVLLEGETIELCFKSQKDLVIFTTKRFLRIDTEGFAGQRKVSYKSVPYKSTACFAVTGSTRHPFDWYCEMKMFADIGHWGLDVRKEQGDIAAAYGVINKKAVLDKMVKPDAPAPSPASVK
jgi:hypothetical protein